MKTHLLRVIFTIIFGTKPCYSQSVVRMQGGYGLVSGNNEMLIQDCQSILKVDVGREKAFILKKDNHFAVCVSSEKNYTGGYNMYGEMRSEDQTAPEANDWSKINFEYDEIVTIQSQNPEIDFVVRKDGLYGAINSLNRITLPIKYDTVFSIRENVFLTLVKKDSKYAIVSDNMIGEFSASWLSFDYDAVSFKNESDFAQLRKGDHYAVAYSSENGNTLISPPVFDSIISGDQFFLKALKGDSTFFLYSQKTFSGRDNAWMIDLPAKTFFYNLYTNNQFEADLVPGKYEFYLFYPYAYLIDKDSEMSVIDLGRSKTISRGRETDVKKISVAGNYYSWDYLQFMSQNAVADDFTNETTIYTMLDHQEVFSCPLDPKVETLHLKIYEKDDDYIKVSCENLDNHKIRTVGYIRYGAQVTFSKQKPIKESRSYSGRGGGGTNWMDFLWIGGR